MIAQERCQIRNLTDNSDSFGTSAMPARKYHHTWDDLAYIDTAHMQRWGAFEGYSGPLTFEGFDPEKAEWEHDVSRDRGVIVWVSRTRELVRATVGLERFPCPYDRPDATRGGRVYFQAPCCGRRVRKLALLPQGVRCGLCGSITSGSKRKSGVQLIIYRAEQLAMRLECANWYSAPVKRPLHMRRETFNELANEHAAVVARAMAIIQPRLVRAAGRSGMLGQMCAVLRYGL
jgi:hypothetical protein